MRLDYTAGILNGRRIHLLVVLTSALSIAACGPRDASATMANSAAPADNVQTEASRVATIASQSGLTVRDSAGISIVEVSAAFINRLPVWRAGSTPKVSIGSVDGEPAYLFDGIRRTGVAKLTNGSLAIVDGRSSVRGSAEIRIFDSTGRFLRRIGRKGQGPGEFESPPDIHPLPGGGLIASYRTRITKFDANGKITDNWEVPVTNCPERCSNRSMLANGSYAVFSTDPQPPVAPEMAGRTIAGLRAYYGHASRETTRVVATINMPLHKVLVRAAQQLRGGLSAATATLVSRPLLSPAPEYGIVPGQDRFAVVLHDPLEFRIFNANAKPVRIIRVMRPRVRITDAEKRALIATDIALSNTSGKVVSDYWPEFEYVRFGDNDDLWLQDFHRSTSGEPGPVAYTIFGNDGIPVARLDCGPNPVWKDQSRSPVHQAPSGRDAYRVITRDSLGVERLLIFAIVKG